VCVFPPSNFLKLILNMHSIAIFSSVHYEQALFFARTGTAVDLSYFMQLRNCS